MNRQELLAAQVALNAQWVDEMVAQGLDTDDYGQPVDPTPEQEEPYLQEVSDLVGIGGGDDEQPEPEPEPEALTAAAFRFDPHQVRDTEGKWSKTPGVALPNLSGLSAWNAQEASADLPMEAEAVLRIGSEIAKVMRRDGVTVQDPEGFFNAAMEALEGDDITPRRYIATLDRQYGTLLGGGVEAALRARDVAGGGSGDTSAPAGPKLPDFSAPYAQRVAAMEANAKGQPVATTALSGGKLADVKRMDWGDRSRTVTKRAVSSAGQYDALHQADAEDLGARVAAALGMRAPAVRRVGPDEVEMEFMPGETAMQKYGAIGPKDVVGAPENMNIGLFDYLTANADRHTGNWTVDDDGKVYGIDHGLAFQSNIGILAYGPFALQHGFSIGTPKISGPELARTRAALEGLRADFSEQGRSDWFEAMMSRLDDVESRVGGE